MADLVQLVCDLYEAPDGTFVVATIEPELTSSFEILRSMAALQPGPSLTSVTCQTCGTDHAVDTEPAATSRRYTYFCPFAGRVPLNDTDLATVRLDYEWLVSWLSQALGITSHGRRRAVVSDHVWHVGDAVCGQTNVTIVFARRIVSPSALDRLASELRAIHPAEKGLVITTSPNFARQIRLPGGYEIIQLPVIARESESRLILDHQRLGSWIRGMEPATAKGGKGRIGRPLGPFETVARIYRQRRETRVRFVSERAEAKAILNEWPKYASDQEPPHISSVRRYLKQLLAESDCK